MFVMPSPLPPKTEAPRKEGEAEVLVDDWEDRAAGRVPWRAGKSQELEVRHVVEKAGAAALSPTKEAGQLPGCQEARGGKGRGDHIALQFAECSAWATSFHPQ